MSFFLLLLPSCVCLRLELNHSLPKQIQFCAHSPVPDTTCPPPPTGGPSSFDLPRQGDTREPCPQSPALLPLSLPSQEPNAALLETCFSPEPPKTLSHPQPLSAKHYA